MATTTLWQQVEPILREKAYASLDHDPQSLLDGDAGGFQADVEVIMARLIGFDDQIVEDGWRLERVEPVLLLPLFQKMTLARAAAPVSTSMPRAARYVLQGGYAIAPLDPMYAPPGIRPNMTTWTVRVLYLRYRRRS